MPNRDTLSIKPIGLWAKKHLYGLSETVDPFARNSRIAKYRNDLNPNTAAEHHMAASDFIDVLWRSNVIAEAVIFDPPYSLRQVKECYESIGNEFTMEDSQNAVRWSKERDGILNITKPGSVVVSFGWSSTGMGKKRGFEIFDILLVCHGGAHYDTICIAERRVK